LSELISDSLGRHDSLKRSASTAILDLIRSQCQAGLVPGRRAAFPPQRGDLCRLDRTNMPAFIRAHHAPAPASEALLQG
jgi:hypothetical protein